MTRLTDDERSLLVFLNKEGEGGDVQINTWAISAGDPWRKGSDLQSLKRRGLVDAEGRGNARAWWITKKGIAALGA